MLPIGRLYYSQIDAISVSAVADLWWVGSPTDAITVIEEIFVSQDASETSEQLPLRMFRTTTDNAAVGTANTPNPAEVGTPAYGGTVRTNITGASLAAETTPLPSISQNILNGWHWLPTPGHVIVLSPVAGTAGRFVVKLDAVPGAALTISGYVALREIGG